ncbi:hypothetical protein [Erythrobacter sp. YT30]|uniref:hypothetical protein n=1 Tax=Erythrobacter sp. YT30 TaxID=1735012 RepID=UPI0012E34AE2|nr:hypothetical protein [Erythrobacter sp. YT30]
MTIAQLQFLVFLFTCGSLLSAAWLVSHARDTVLVLRHIFPKLRPGEGVRLTNPKSVCIAITLFGYCLSAETLLIFRGGAYL